VTKGDRGCQSRVYEGYKGLQRMVYRGQTWSIRVCEMVYEGTMRDYEGL
jgi:hypothetical protein